MAQTERIMEKKIYQQPLTQNKLAGFNLPIAQLPVGSDEHEDQWTKRRDEELDFEHEDEFQDVKYGNLW